MQTEQIARWLTYFYIYCFLGWIWESCYVSVLERKLVNRGFLKGPLLPIYGSGAVCILLVTLPIRDNYWLMALVGMGAATGLEYATGAVMEALFKVRYWDYTKEFLNLSGYICLKSTLCWGAMTFLVIYGIHPLVAGVVKEMPENILETIDLVVTALAGADFATSFKAAIDFRNVLVRAEKIKEELKNIQARLDDIEQQLAEKTKETIADGATKAKETLVSGAVKSKETLVEGAVKTKETLVGGAVKTKETLVGGAVKTKDTFVNGAARTKDTLVGGAVRTKDALVGGAARTKDTLVDGAMKAKDQLWTEWQELTLGKHIRLERLRSGYSRSIRGLLRRNPDTVSKRYSESFEEMKNYIKEKEER